MAYVGLSLGGPVVSTAAQEGLACYQAGGARAYNRGVPPQEVGWRVAGVVRVYVCHMWLR